MVSTGCNLSLMSSMPVLYPKHRELVSTGCNLSLMSSMPVLYPKHSRLRHVTSYTLHLHHSHCSMVAASVCITTRPDIYLTMGFTAPLVSVICNDFVFHLAQDQDVFHLAQDQDVFHLAQDQDVFHLAQDQDVFHLVQD